MTSGNLTVLNKLGGKLILLVHQSQIQRGSVSYLVVDIVETSGKEDLDASLHVRVLLANAELGEGRYGGSSNNGILQDDAVIDVSDVLCRLRGLGALQSKEMENAHGKLGELAVLNELTQVGQGILFGVGHELDEVEHALDDGALELVAALVAEDAAEEGQHASLLAGEL